MTEQDLFNLKNRVDEAKTTITELKGQLNAMTKQFKNDWDDKSPEDAEGMLKVIENDITTIEDTIEKGIEELEEKYIA